MFLFKMDLKFSILTFPFLLNYIHSHLPAGALNSAHGGLEILGIEIRHLSLGDFLYLRLGDLAGGDLLPQL